MLKHLSYLISSTHTLYIVTCYVQNNNDDAKTYGVGILIHMSVYSSLHLISTQSI